jgi:putative phosphoesterase
MKVVVFSDAHGNKRAIKRILDFNPDATHVISLGDSELRHKYLLDLNIIAVRGNYPMDGGIGYESILKIEGKKIFITHGHKYGVRRDIRELVLKATKSPVDIVLFGHTHIPSIDKIKGVYYLNPGSLVSPRTHHAPSYLILNIEKDKEITFVFKESKTNKVMEDI